MTISRLGSNTSDSGGGNLSFSHTLVAGSDRKVVVLVGFENDGTRVPSVTYGGETMTEGAGCNTGVADLLNGAYVFYIDEVDLPANGANTVAVTFSGGASQFEAVALCAEFGGVASGIEDSDSTCEGSPGNDTIETTGFSGGDTDLFCSAYTCGNVGTNWTYGQSQNELLDAPLSSSRHGFTDLIATGAISTLEGTFVSSANRLGAAAVRFIVSAVPAELEQEGFRWRNDDDDEANATWRQDQDVDDEIAKETNIRLRTILNATGDPDTQQFEIQYKETSDAASEWRKIPEA
jgi:hypothetical protein